MIKIRGGEFGML